MKRDMLVGTLILCSAVLTASHPQRELNEIFTDDLEEDVDSSKLSDYLIYLLTSPTDVNIPVVYLQDEATNPIDTVEKRSSVSCETRYYRRYPWKRQNGRGGYDPDGYLCTPTREDVFHLLMALHETRSGNGDRTISFCNRRRPARAILTNMRFIGKR